MDALLRIRADVTGEGNVTALGRAIGGIKTQAAAASSGLKGLAGAAGMGGLAGAMGALTPLLSVAGLVGMAKSSMDAGDAMYDLSQKTGVSVESLAKFKKAASTSGTTIDAVGAAMGRLSKAMAASLADTADSATASADRIKATAKQQAEQNIQIAKDGAERQIQAVKDGERRQLDAVKEQADKRLDAIEQESDRRLSELNRRYRAEEKLLNDKYTDEADRREEEADKAQQAEERAIERSYEAKMDAIQDNENIDKYTKKAILQSLRDQQQQELDVVRDRYRDEGKIRSRALRDQQDAEMMRLEDRKKKEEDQMRAKYDAQKKIVEDGVKAQTEAISRNADESEKAIRTAADATIKTLEATVKSVDPLSDAMEDMGLNGKGASKALADLGISLKNTDGSIKSVDEVMLSVADKFKEMPDGFAKTSIAMKLFGKAGMEMIPMLNMGGDAIESMKVKMTTAFAKDADKYKDKLIALSGKVGSLGMDITKALLPALDGITDAVTKGVDAFNKLDPTLRGFIVTAAIVAIGFGGITYAVSALLTALISLSSVIGGLGIGATIAGWAGAIVPAIATITAAFTGLLSFLTTTILPGLVAFFSGPVGWTVLAVAAVTAMAIAFREPIAKFFAWLWSWSEPVRAFFIGIFDKALQIVVNAWKVIGSTIKSAVEAVYAVVWQVFVRPWVILWETTLRKPVGELWEWLKKTWTSVAEFWTKNIVAPIQSAWNALGDGLRDGMQRAVNFVRGIWTGLINGLRGIINGFLEGWASNINKVIGGVNMLIDSFNKLPGPDISPVDYMEVPRFATGGVVDRPTLAMVGEGGEREYIIPESKMPSAAAAYMGGARGSQVLAPGVINVTTGPVLQQQGQQWVTMADLERAMRTTEASTLGRIRTPAGRAALGIR